MSLILSPPSAAFVREPGRLLADDLDDAAPVALALEDLHRPPSSVCSRPYTAAYSEGSEARREGLVQVRGSNHALLAMVGERIEELVAALLSDHDVDRRRLAGLDLRRACEDAGA